MDAIETARKKVKALIKLAVDSYRRRDMVADLGPPLIGGEELLLVIQRAERGVRGHGRRQAGDRHLHQRIRPGLHPRRRAPGIMPCGP